MWSYGSQTDIRVAGGLQFHPIKSKSYQTGTTHWHSPISLRHLGVSQALSSATTFVSTLTPVSQISNCGLIVGDALCNMASPLPVLPMPRRKLERLLRGLFLVMIGDGPLPSRRRD